jgi:microcystin-dependent protein
MLSTPRRGIAYPEPTARLDAPDIPLHIENVAQAADADVLYGQGTTAARPAAGTVPEGYLWWHTDTTPKKMSYHDGVNWNDVSGQDPLIGSTHGWPWDAASIPASCILPYGQAISRATYAVLHTLAAGATYPYGNGDGSTTFNVPDERGRVEVGKGNMGGTNANRITTAISGSDGTVLGATVGVEGVSITTGQMPAHNHGGGVHTHTFNTNDLVVSGASASSGVTADKMAPQSRTTDASTAIITTQGSGTRTPKCPAVNHCEQNHESIGVI